MGRPGLVGVALVPALVIFAVRAWLVEPVLVSSDSMEPAVSAGAVVFLYGRRVGTGTEWCRGGLHQPG